MRLKTFSAKSMAEVMRQVRAEMGEDAIIVATRKSESGAVRVTAAVDTRPAAEAAAADAGEAREETTEFLRRALLGRTPGRSFGALAFNLARAC